MYVNVHTTHAGATGVAPRLNPEAASSANWSRMAVEGFGYGDANPALPPPTHNQAEYPGLGGGGGKSSSSASSSSGLSSASKWAGPSMSSNSVTLSLVSNRAEGASSTREAQSTSSDYSFAPSAAALVAGPVVGQSQKKKRTVWMSNQSARRY